MSLPCILFVEPEAAVLQGLMRQVNDVLEECQIVLSMNYEAALEVLSQRVCSVVIASCGTRVTEGEAFLSKVQARHPAVVRYAFLPGDDEEGQRCLSLAHASQCFTVNCPPGELATAIQCGLDIWRRCHGKPELQKLLMQLDNIPTPPTLYFDLREEMQSRDCDNARISGLLSRDPALCARVLKLANSCFYALPRTVSDVNEALMYLGTDVLLSLVLATHVFNHMPVPGISLDALWHHSLASSLLSRQICSQLGADPQQVNAAATAGLLHDMGQLILLSNMPERYYPLVHRSGGDESLLLKLEQEEIGVGHPELCAHVLALWSLPEMIVDAVASHHLPMAFTSAGCSPVSSAVGIAEWLMQESFSRENTTGEAWEMPCMPHCTQAQIDEWKASCSKLLANDLQRIA